MSEDTNETPVVSLGPEFPPDIDDAIESRRFSLIVVYYESGQNEGSGVAVLFESATDKVFRLDLGHCSCDGPFGTWEKRLKPTTVDEILRDKDDAIEWDYPVEVKGFIASLVSATDD